MRNTYEVLLTRGMKATAVYSTDTETQEFLEKIAGESSAPTGRPSEATHGPFADDRPIVSRCHRNW